MRPLIDQARDRTRRALRELDAAVGLLESGGSPVGAWIDEARRATEGALRVLNAHHATAASRRRGWHG